MNTCPAGHASKASDYCDVCGVAIDAAPSPSDTALMPAVGTATDTPCPHCGAANPVDALFCEACGYDFTTGTLPRPLTPPDPTTPPVAESPAPPLAPAWEPDSNRLDYAQTIDNHTHTQSINCTRRAEKASFMMISD